MRRILTSNDAGNRPSVYHIQPLKPLLSPDQQLRSEAHSVAKSHFKQLRRNAKRLRDATRSGAVESEAQAAQ